MEFQLSGTTRDRPNQERKGSLKSLKSLKNRQALVGQAQGDWFRRLSTKYQIAYAPRGWSTSILIYLRRVHFSTNSSCTWRSWMPGLVRQMRRELFDAPGWTVSSSQGSRLSFSGSQRRYDAVGECDATVCTTHSVVVAICLSREKGSRWHEQQHRETDELKYLVQDTLKTRNA